MKIVENKTLRVLLIILGWLSVALGIIGIFLPLMPTTPFLLVAAWCFLRSSKKAHDWLYNHRLFGPALKNWDEKGAIDRKAKIFASLTICGSITMMWYLVPIVWLKTAVTLLLFSIIVFLLTRPEP